MIAFLRQALAAVVVLIAWATAAVAADAAVAVMYHRFGENAHPSTNIRLDQFEAHIAELTRGDYVVLPLPEIVAALRSGRSLPERTVAITIDDAWKSVYREAWPRLRSAGLPFTLFVSTDEIDQRLPDHMTWDEIRELAAAGVTIASQGGAHLHMAAASPAAVAADLERSARRLYEELGELPTMFAWPYGEASLQAMDEARQTGIEVAFGQHSGVMFAGADLRYLPRFPLNETYGDLERFRTVARALPLPVADLTPADPRLTVNPPPFGFTVLPGIENLDRISCFASHTGRMQVQRLGRRIEARTALPFPPGRGRINCTLPDRQGWRWFGYQYFVP